jgi:cold shock protein
MKNLKLAALISTTFLIYSCEQKTDVVETGTYQGTVDKVEAGKSEIYVETADGKRLELYFTDSTSLTQNGSKVSFDQLAKGKKVEVDVEKMGKRLDPKAVRILE